jgi:putative ABC transport system substrate-binding protein
MRGAFRPGLLSGLKQTSHFKRVTTVFDPKAVNLQIDIRWSGGNADGINKNAVELAALAPVVIVASGSSTVGPLLQATRTVPIVFVVLPDPVGAGFVDSLARPGGSATGFTSFEYGIGGKWLETLKEIAPSVTRVAVFRDSTITAGMGQWGAIQASAPKFAIEVSPINLRDAGEIERSVTEFAHKGNGGLGLFATGISALVLLIAAHDRPFVGQIAVTPEPLLQIISDPVTMR